MAGLGNVGNRLYTGDLVVNFVGRRKFWYGISLLIVVISLAGLGFRGLQLGVDFQGGAVFNTPPTQVSVEEARDVAEEASGRDARVQELGTDGSLRIQVTGLDTDESDATREALADALGIPVGELDAEVVGPSWGDQMTTKAAQGFVIFLVLVGVYLAVAFEWRMALAALIALLNDLIVTVGVYAIVGFEVTPGTVIGVLTILSYSLYDSVVVFDKVREKARNFEKQTRSTYGELVNYGVNATLIRSMNTSIVALLPVSALLFIGAGLFGGGMLRDISLSLFVGLAAGAYSSITIAPPLLVDLKRYDQQVRAHDRRIRAKRAKRAAGEGTEEPGAADGGDGADAADETGPDARDASSEETRAESADAGDSGDEAASEGEEPAAVPAGKVTGQRAQRRQPVSRSRGRGRPSGKRR